MEQIKKDFIKDYNVKDNVVTLRYANDYYSQISCKNPEKMGIMHMEIEKDIRNNTSISCMLEQNKYYQKLSKELVTIYNVSPYLFACVMKYSQLSYALFLSVVLFVVYRIEKLIDYNEYDKIIKEVEESNEFYQERIRNYNEKK